jgi:hypothetical protein
MFRIHIAGDSTVRTAEGFSAGCQTPVALSPIPSWWIRSSAVSNASLLHEKMTVKTGEAKPRRLLVPADALPMP